MYKEDMGFQIMIKRKYVCGYSQRRLAKLLNEDVETIRMIENGSFKTPPPQLILRIAGILDSFYMEFVNEEYEDEFLSLLEWGTDDEVIIDSLKHISLILSNVAIKLRTKGKIEDA